MRALSIDVKDCLQTILRVKNISAYQFAKENGLPRSQISRWMHGDYEPRGKTLIWIYNYSEKLKQ